MIDFTPSVRLSVCLIACLLGWLEPNAQSTEHRQGPWVPDGYIWHVRNDDGYTMMSGWLSAIGPYTGGAVFIDPTTGAQVTGFPKVHGSVSAVIADGTGGWYLGGNFNVVGDVQVLNLVHIKADKTVDTAWKPNPISGVESMALSGNTLYLGGYGELYYDGGAGTRSYLAAVSTTTGQTTAWNPTPDGSVLAMQVVNNTLYVGGNFSNIGATPRSKIAAIDLTTGLPTTWNPNVASPMYGSIEHLLIDEATGVAFVAGEFEIIGGQNRYKVAQLRLSDGQATSWQADVNMNGNVWGLARYGTNLLVGGNFNVIDGSTQNTLALLDPKGNLMPTDFGFADGDQILGMTLSGNTLYFSGQFQQVAGQDRHAYAAINLSTNTVATWDPSGPDFDAVASYDMHAANNLVCVGGYFTTLRTLPRNGFALLNDATDQPWPYDINLNGGRINTMAIDGNTLYVGGLFNSIGRSARNNLAAFDLTTGALLPWAPSVEGECANCPPEVFDMRIYNGQLYVAGKFVTVAGQTRPGLAALNLTTGAPSAWNPTVGDGKTSTQYVNAIDLVGNTLYAVGNFSLVKGAAYANIVAIDLTTGTPTTWNPGSTAEVFKIRVKGNEAFVVGNFERGVGANNQLRDFDLAALDLATGNALPFNPDLGNSVRDIAVSSTDLFIAGNFDLIDDTDFRPGLASYNLATKMLNDWRPDTGDGGEGNNGVNTIELSPTRLHIGGPFINLGDELRAYYGEYDVCTLRPSLSLSGTTLTVDATGTYQWYVNGQLAEGETTASLEINPLEYGEYYVVVDDGSCAAQTSTFTYLVTPNEAAAGNAVAAYPNPVHDQLTVRLPETTSATLTLTDIVGRPVRTFNAEGGEAIVSLSDLQSGPYVLVISSGAKTYTHKIVKIN